MSDNREKFPTNGYLEGRSAPQPSPTGFGPACMSLLINTHRWLNKRYFSINYVIVIQKTNLAILERAYVCLKKENYERMLEVLSV